MRKIAARDAGQAGDSGVAAPVGVISPSSQPSKYHGTRESVNRAGSIEYRPGIDCGARRDVIGTAGKGREAPAVGERGLP